MVIAKGFARIHWQNLINFGVLPLTLVEPAVHDKLAPDDVLHVERLWEQLTSGPRVKIVNITRSSPFAAEHQLSARQLEVLRAGGLINWVKSRDGPTPRPGGSPATAG